MVDYRRNEARRNTVVSFYSNALFWRYQKSKSSSICCDEKVRFSFELLLSRGEGPQDITLNYRNTREIMVQVAAVLEGGFHLIHLQSCMDYLFRDHGK